MSTTTTRRFNSASSSTSSNIVDSILSGFASDTSTSSDLFSFGDGRYLVHVGYYNSNHTRSLTPEQVASVRVGYIVNGFGFTEMARLLPVDVSPTTVRNAVIGWTYNHITVFDTETGESY